MTEVEEGFTQWVTVKPAYDCLMVQPCMLGQNCNGGHGRSGAMMGFYLRGPLGVVDFSVWPGWNRDETLPAYASKPDSHSIGFHSPTPRYEDQPQTCRVGECTLLPDTVCYGDRSYVRAQDVFRVLRHEGTDAMWALLREEYAHWFEQEQVPA